MTRRQVLAALRRRIVPLASEGLSRDEMRRELHRVLMRANVSASVAAALLDEVQAELSFVAARTASASVRQLSSHLVQPFAPALARLAPGLQQRFERDVLPLVARGATVADVQNALRRTVRLAEHQTRTLAETSVAGVGRAGSLLTAEALGPDTRYRYAGPPGERHFCSDLTRRSASGETWTLEQIRAMSNGQGLPVEFYAGGYRCRHRWVVAFDAPAGAKTAPSAARGPSGTPVSAALAGPSSGKTAKALARTLRAIDSVHGDGALPSIPVERSQSKKYLGAYMYSARGDDARSIRLASDLHPHMTLAHEIGHFIDHKGLPGAGFSTQTGRSELDAWRSAVQSSKAFDELTERYIDAVAGEPGAPSVRFMKYAMGEDELFARSYAQYVAVRSGDPEMLAELAASRTGKWAALQWDDEDFAPVAEAFDDLFRTQGWITQTTD